MKVFRILRAMLREIFEESAYERFCTREGLQRGRESYARFLRELHPPRSVEVRCC